MIMWMSVLMNVGTHREQMRTSNPGAGVRGVCEPLNVGSQKQAQYPFLPAAPSPHPLKHFLLSVLMYVIWVFLRYDFHHASTCLLHCSPLWVDGYPWDCSQASVQSLNEATDCPYCPYRPVITTWINRSYHRSAQLVKIKSRSSSFHISQPTLGISRLVLFNLLAESLINRISCRLLFFFKQWHCFNQMSVVRVQLTVLS